MNGLAMNSFWQNFLGHAPDWYKKTVVLFLLINPLLLLLAGPTVTGWVVVLEFIFTSCTTLCPNQSVKFSNFQKRLAPDTERVESE